MTASHTGRISPCGRLPIWRRITGGVGLGRGSRGIRSGTAAAVSAAGGSGCCPTEVDVAAAAGSRPHGDALEVVDTQRQSQDGEGVGGLRSHRTGALATRKCAPPGHPAPCSGVPAGPALLRRHRQVGRLETIGTLDPQRLPVRSVLSPAAAGAVRRAAFRDQHQDPAVIGQQGLDARILRQRRDFAWRLRPLRRHRRECLPPRRTARGDDCARRRRCRNRRRRRRPLPHRSIPCRRQAGPPRPAAVRFALHPRRSTCHQRHAVNSSRSQWPTSETATMRLPSSLMTMPE